MSAFRESFLKELGRGLAYFLVSIGAWILCALSGAIPVDKKPALTLLLFLFSGLLLWLFAILFLRLLSFRKVHKKVLDLEKRVEASEPEIAAIIAERKEWQRQIEETAKKIKPMTPNNVLEPTATLHT